MLASPRPTRRVLLMPAAGARPVPPPPPTPDAELDPDDQLARYRRPAFVPGPADEALAQVLRRPPRPGTSVAAHFDDLERRLVDVLRDQPLGVCRALARRLDEPHPDDALVAALGQLTGERRARLRAVLAAAPRRALLRCA